MFISLCVAVSLGRRLVQWTIIDVQNDDRTFRGLFNEVQAGKFECVEVSDELKRATLSQVFVGGDKDKLMVTSASLSLCSVCEEFGKYVKFVVDVYSDEAAPSFQPVRMDPDAFASLHFLPNPIPGLDDHYKSFEEVYGPSSSVSDKHRPSLQHKKRKATSFSPSQQHVKNVGVLLQCEECDKWRLLFCKHKLNAQEVSDLQRILEDVAYSCGTALEDIDMPGRLANVFVKDHSCEDGMEKLYYSCGFEAVCVHCASDDVTDLLDSEFLPQCEDCEHLGQVRRPKKKS